MRLAWQRRRLELRHEWTLSRGSDAYKEYAFLEIAHEGITGYGEAAHNVRYGESLESVEAVFERAASEFADISPDVAKPIGVGAAAAAIDMALLDWCAQKRGAPLHAHLGIEAKPVTTCYSIGIDADPDILAEKIREADAFPILKIKLGTKNDRSTIETVRSITDKPLWIDANEGWTDRNHALAMIEWLADRNVELIEQPLPANRLADSAWMRERSPLPLIADEDVLTSTEIPHVADAYDGVNIKLMKAGGIREALRMIASARAHGLSLMLGCMVESSLAITAASHIAPLADHVDLDGNLLNRNDPFTGTPCIGGVLTPPSAPGIGAVPNDRGTPPASHR